MASDAKPRKKKGGFTAADWAELDGWTEAGDVHDGFCRECSSGWCPHASPDTYAVKERSRFYAKRPVGAPPRRVTVTVGESGRGGRHA